MHKTLAPVFSPARLLSRLLFPLLVVGAPAAAWGLLAAGAPAGLAATGVLAGELLLLALLERRLPHEPGWRPGRGDTGTDLVYLLTLMAPDKLTRALVALGVTALAAWLAPSAGGLGGASGLPLWLRGALAFLLGDLGKYWVHRLSHERASLWAIHAVHHAPSRLYALNGLRLHPLNVAWNAFFDVAPVLALGLPPWLIAVLGALRGSVSVLQHANVRLVPGLLHTIVNSPNAHRWHHARSMSEASCNYGSTLLVWDRLFGTYRRGEEASHPPALGFEGDEAMPSTWAGQALWPLCGPRLLTSCLTPRLRKMLR